MSGQILIDGGRSARGFSRIGALLRCAQLFANAERPRLLLGRQLVSDGVSPENLRRFWYGWEQGNLEEVTAAFESAGYDLLSEEDDDVAHHSGNPDAKRVALVRGSLIHCGLAHWYAAVGAMQGGVLISADLAQDLGGPRHYGGMERVQPPGMEPCVVVTDPAVLLEPEDAMRVWCARHPAGEEWLPLCLNAVRGYARRWQEDAQKWRILAVECSHTTSLGVLDCKGHPEHGDPLPYSARLDLEFSVGAGSTMKVYSTDHKSIGRVTNKAAQYYSMHGQFTGHRVIGFETWGEKFGDAVLNLVETSGEVYARPPLEPSPGLTVSFKKRMLRMEHYRAQLELETLQGKLPIDEWPAAMNELSCYHRYGKCGSWDVCRWGGA